MPGDRSPRSRLIRMAKTVRKTRRKPDKPGTVNGVGAQAKYAGSVHLTTADVDYSLRRRSLLREVYAGRVDVAEVCDASPYLVSASKFHGEETQRRCPICRREFLWLVHYIFGDELRSSAGQARGRAELAMLARGLDHFDVYVVEVCRGCGWNHLINRFALGRDNPTPPPAAGATSPTSPDEAGRHPRDMSRPIRTDTRKP